MIALFFHKISIYDAPLHFKYIKSQIKKQTKQVAPKTEAPAPQPNPIDKSHSWLYSEKKNFLFALNFIDCEIKKVTTLVPY